DDVAEGIISHLPAQDVPAERQDDHDPEHRELDAEGGQQEGCRHGEGEQRERQCLAHQGHARYRRWRRGRHPGNAGRAPGAMHTDAIWSWGLRMNATNCSAAPRPRAATMTPGRLPSPAMTTIMKDRTV